MTRSCEKRLRVFFFPADAAPRSVRVAAHPLCRLCRAWLAAAAAAPKNTGRDTD